MAMPCFRHLLLCACAGPGLLACSSESVPAPSSEAHAACEIAAFAIGSAEGHPDPLGAKAAGQARAGRLASASLIAQPAHGRQRVAAGDFLLINDKIAVVIEDKGLSDGYARFGG